MTRAECQVLAAARARDLCLSLRRAFVGPAALARLRGGAASSLSPDDLRLALGLAWAEGDLGLVRATLAGLPAAEVERDAVLLALRDAAGRERT